MLHGSIVNLHEWDLVVERLKSRYHLVRLDWPPYGVSGPDPSGVYSTPRAAELLAGLVDRLALAPFTLVATSNGVNVALEYAAHHPEHVRAMALSIVPLERPSQTRAVPWRMKLLQQFHARWLPDYHSRIWYRWMLESTTPPKFHPTDALVELIYEPDNLPGAAARQRQYIDSTIRAFQTSDVGAIAEQIHVPVLIQWCGYDTVISQSADRTVARFTGAPVELVRYPDLGHFPMWEDPDRFTADLARFLERVGHD
jgi:pimeloyl-ACP methyl ester carboxylesterase